MTYITLDPYIPLALWVPLALAAAALLAWYAWASRGRLPRRRWLGVVTLMAVAVALPLAILLNPTWIERIPPPQGKPLLTILVDRSLSMATRDAEDGRSRYEAAAQLAAAAAAQLGDRYEVRIRTFAETSSPASPEELATLKPDGPGTDVAGVIESALDEGRAQGQALLLLSDGIHNARGGTARLREAAAKAKALAAPVYVRTIGGPTKVEDLEVTLERPQELAFVGQRVPVVVVLQQQGSLGQGTRLSLMLDDKPLDEREVKLVPDGVAKEVFQVTQNRSGLYRYEVRAKELPGEVTGLNNTATLLLRVVDQPIRVLLLEGKPYWDTKFLIRTLSMDQSIELTSVVRLAEGRLLQRKIARPAASAEGATGGSPAADNTGATGGSPASAVRTDEWTIQKDPGQFLGDPESLNQYQIVVLGRDAEVYLTGEALSRLKKWLNQGNGSLVCFRGPPSSQISQRLGELMPLRWTPAGGESRFRVQLTGKGPALGWLSSGDGDALAAMPSLATVSRSEAPRYLAQVWATSVSGAPGQQTPVITYQPVGNGHVVAVEGAGMWRWAFLPPQHQQRDEVYGMLWRSLIRWLVSNVGLLPSQQLALQSEKVTFHTNESAAATLLVRESQLSAKPPEIELTGDALREPKRFTPLPQGSTPGAFHVAFGPLPEGRYRARVLGAADEVSATAVFDVRGNLKERLDIPARAELMQQEVAVRSGGAVLDDPDPGRLAEQFDEHLVRSRPPRTAQTTAWDRWWVLLAAFTMWAGAWGLRRRSGLV